MLREMQINTLKERWVRKKKAWHRSTTQGTKKKGRRETSVCFTPGNRKSQQKLEEAS